MSFIDWIIVGLMLALVGGIAVYTQQFVKGVADFLAAGRVAGRYVVSVASGEAGMGLISMVAIWEMYYKSGFAIGFWNGISVPIGLMLMVTGYCIYRFRETRALTMGQMLEIRYSRRFRIFAGCLSALSGIINYGLFPAVGARFIVYFCELPPQLEFLGMQWPTFAIIMAIFLSIGAIFAMMGGQLTVMTTDCVMGILSYPIYMIVVFYLLSQFSWWNEIAPTLLDRPEGQSMLNPFDTAALRDFNMFYVFVGIFASIYGGAGLTWLGTQGYNAAAVNAHEQKMSRILGLWRGGFMGMMIILTSAVAYTYMHHPNFAERADATRVVLKETALGDIAPDLYLAEPASGYVDASAEQLRKEQPAAFQSFETIQKQMLVPSALRDILPIGILGLFCALMIFLMTSTDSTYMHSWGSILVQDIAMPLRKKPFTPKEQLFWLRVAIAGVAVYAFVFSFYFGQVTYILMFFAITGAIWAGAGAVIVLGLYWPKGTTAAAWFALISGAAIAVGGFILTNAWVGTIYPLLSGNPALLAWLSGTVEAISSPFEPYILWRVTSDKFFMNGQEINFLSMITSVVGYVVISLLTCREKFNMDRMLHRGAYQRDDEKLEPPLYVQVRKKGLGVILKTMSGIDGNFTRGDKILSWSVIVWSLGWGFGSFLTILIWNLISPWPQEWWANWFFIASIVVASTVGIVSTVWFSIGGTRDLIQMFARLRCHEDDTADDGRVIGHVSADDLPHEGDKAKPDSP
jgi:SSS family solute:Na+ symporter